MNDNVILENQFTFVVMWKILDGILVANEIIYEAQKNKRDLE